MTTAARLSKLCLLLGAASALAAFLVAPGAHAAPAATSCPGTVEHPFLPWVDPAAYVLAPAGTFEGKSPWQLGGGSKLVRGNEPFHVHRSTDAGSLSIPAGGSAVSPSFCVGLGDPDLRFFAVGATPASLLEVDVVYPTALGTVTQPVALVVGTGTWGPTLQSPLIANITGLASLDGLTSSIRLRFRSLAGSWKIDDVYVDPWKVT